MEFVHLIQIVKFIGIKLFVIYPCYLFKNFSNVTLSFMILVICDLSVFKLIKFISLGPRQSLALNFEKVIFLGVCFSVRFFCLFVCLCFCLFAFSWAAACGGSQARGRIGAVAAGLH